MFRKIITICTGNICRSPMTEAVLHRALEGSGIEVCSAGIAALIGYPADPLSRAVMLDNGQDISAHRARQATQSLLTSMDLILAHDSSHIEWIRACYPQLSGRTYRLGHWRGNADVADPVNQPKAAFEQAYAEIGLYSGDWLKRIKPA
jgi:protein-tyrosine phosphatase